MDANDRDDVEQDMDIGDVNRVRGRENDNVSENGRNLRQHLDHDNIFTSAFERNVALGMHNVRVVQNETAGAATRRPFNPSSVLIPLSTLLSVGSNHGTNLILIILSIASVAENNQTKYQQSYKGNFGAVDSVRHDRRMSVMCPLSPAGSNTAMILFGAGCCERLFEGEISMRDNGNIRYYSINYIFISVLK